MGLTGFEPVTSSLSAKRSNQLSYRPMPGNDIRAYQQNASSKNSQFACRARRVLTYLSFVKDTRSPPMSAAIALNTKAHSAPKIVPKAI